MATDSRLHLELDITLLEEAHNLVRGRHASIVVRLQRLSAHLLLSEDAPLPELVAQKLLHLLLILGRDIGEVAEVGLLLEHLEQFGLVHNLLPGCVDESAALGQLHKEILVDRLLCLRRERHMERDILLGEETLNAFHRSGAELGNLILGNVRVVGIRFHAESHSELVDGLRHSSEAIKGDGPAAQLEAAGAIKIIPSIDQHHAEHELRHSVGILPRRVHGNDFLGRGRLKVDVVIASTSPHDDLQLLRLL
mmetsp:Transcript_71474/g.152747  ORF Transcript_71474/g.152747 Transcript_71474/m.152747 type:complete len:251 (-) Transcript_71474:288-1040(-)